jgi:hypothetical protein
LGSGTGLSPPPDNSFDRRADFSAAHRARKSTPKGLEEAPPRSYIAKGPRNLGAMDPDLARTFGSESEDIATNSPLPEGGRDSPLPSPLWGGVGGGGPSIESPTSRPPPQHPPPPGGGAPRRGGKWK